MTDLILHHYDGSPFAHKIRAILGFKGLAWRSVKIPMIMPKPDLMPLSGGYRRTPVMQAGADIWHDTQLIAAELERRQPGPDPVSARRRGHDPRAHLLGRRRAVRHRDGGGVRPYRGPDAAGLLRRPGRHARTGAGAAGEDHGRRAAAGRGAEPHAEPGRGLAGRRPALPARRRRRTGRLLDLPPLLDAEPGRTEERRAAGALPEHSRLARTPRSHGHGLIGRNGREGGAGRRQGRGAGRSGRKRAGRRRPRARADGLGAGGGQGAGSGDRRGRRRAAQRNRRPARRRARRHGPQPLPALRLHYSPGM